MEIEDILKECNLCPHKCKVNRLEGKQGRCKAGSKAKVARQIIELQEKGLIEHKGSNKKGGYYVK